MPSLTPRKGGLFKGNGVPKKPKVVKPRTQKAPHRKTGKAGQSQVVRAHRRALSAEKAGRSWAKESRKPAKTAAQRKRRVSAGKRAAVNLMSAAKARTQLKRGTTNSNKYKKKK